jgi:hypothetical protein
MDLTTITVSDFKALFRRDFPFLTSYDATKIYNLNDETFYNGLFYQAKADGITGVLPSVAASWNKIPDSQDNYILDTDINNAFAEAQMLLNQGLFGSDAQVKIGYLYLTAHLLANSIRTASQGVQSVGGMIVNSRTVGGVTEAYTVPQDYIDDPVLAVYTSSGYGMKYLGMVIPALRGNIGVVGGWTNP